METIGNSRAETNIDTGDRDFSSTVRKVHDTTRKVRKSVLNYSGIFFGVFIIFVVIVVFTTEIEVTNFADWAALGLSFFILLFCTYAMYVSWSDSGTKSGRASEVYIAKENEYNMAKKAVVDGKMQVRLPEFCRNYIEEELRTTRSSILADIGLPYDVYVKEYQGKDKKTLESDKKLSQLQVKVISEANAVKPIKLTPEMIFKRGKGNTSRNPLGMSPETKKNIHFATRFVRILATSVALSMVVLDVVSTPTWATFAACMLKIFPVCLNGVLGYKMGYENVVIDTVDYMDGQIDLMNQLMQYVDKNPEPVQAEEKAEETVVGEEAVPENETVSGETT